jgi:hypothetical protein
MKDLVCLAADKNIEAALRGLFERPQALGLRGFDFDVFVHPRRDPGCYHEGHEFLRPHQDDYRHGLVVFDRAWEGAPTQNAIALEASVRARLGPSGWADVVVIDPELEVWVWSDSPNVDAALGWSERNPDLRAWLSSNRLWAANEPKPRDPKAAVEAALHEVRKPRSAAIYAQLARTVSVDRCVDASFSRLRNLLRGWFAGGNP